MESLHVEILKPFCNFEVGELYKVMKRDDGKSYIRNGPFRMNEADREWRERKGFIKLVMREVRTVRNDQGQ